MRQTYGVTIKETHSKTVYTRAESPQEAIRIIKTAFELNNIPLTEDDAARGSIIFECDGFECNGGKPSVN